MTFDADIDSIVPAVSGVQNSVRPQARKKQTWTHWSLMGHEGLDRDQSKGKTVRPQAKGSQRRLKGESRPEEGSAEGMHCDISDELGERKVGHAKYAKQQRGIDHWQRWEAVRHKRKSVRQGSEETGSLRGGGGEKADAVDIHDVEMIYNSVRPQARMNHQSRSLRGGGGDQLLYPMASRSRSRSPALFEDGRNRAAEFDVGAVEETTPARRGLIVGTHRNVTATCKQDAGGTFRCSSYVR